MDDSSSRVPITAPLLLSVSQLVLSLAVVLTSSQVPRECHNSAVAVLQLPGLGIWKGQGEVCVLWGGLSVQQHRSIPS